MATIENKRRFLQFKGVSPTQYSHAIALYISLACELVGNANLRSLQWTELYQPACTIKSRSSHVLDGI